MPVQRKYLEMFLEEGAEIVSKLNQRVLSLEQGSADPQTLQSALRLAHTLKGGAKMVGLDNVSHAAHSLETALKESVNGGHELTSGDCTRFLGTLDRIGWVLELVANGREAEALELDPSAPAPEAQDAGGIQAAPKRPQEPVERPKSSADKAQAEPRVERRLGADRVRVSVEKLDSLQNLLDDLTLQKVLIFDHMSRFRRAFAGLERVAWATEDRDLNAREQQTVRKVIRLLTGRGFSAFLETLYGLDQVLGEIQGQVFDLRMVPLAEVLDEYYRTVRDLARELGKEVALAIDGKFTEMDKRLLDAVQAPLIHLVRNAVDHGVEPAEERVRAGKPPEAQVTIRAYHKASTVVLEVEDDGRGLDPDEIRAKVVQRGLVNDEKAKALSDEEIFYFLCEPGFTTRDTVTEVSGRGVGLDVVKARVEKLKGSLAIQAEKGRFTRFRMYLPLSISSLSALIVRAGDSLYALPSLFVDRCLKVRSADVEAQGGMWTHGDRVLPVVSLSRALGLGSEATSDRIDLAVVRFRSRSMILQVDALEQEREIVLKPLGDHLGEVPYILGASFQADGRPVPVLNVLDFYSHWDALEATCRFRSGPVTSPPQVLVVDDSVTTRHMEQNVLESLGYRVALASDGLEAWKLLQRQLFDLVLTDIDMPGMDGIELSRRIRGNQATAHLPVVVVSSRTSDEDVEAGLVAGADAYLRKDRFSQKELGETLRGLLER